MDRQISAEDHLAFIEVAVFERASVQANGRVTDLLIFHKHGGLHRLLTPRWKHARAGRASPIPPHARPGPVQGARGARVALDTPAATQAGLFAKLQGVVQFTADLEEDELYEAEWNTIKADVQRITGEAAHDNAA